MIEISLLIFLGASNLFWAFVCHRLENKLMSRNYTEFVQTERLKKPPIASTKPHVALVDPIAEENAKRANSLFT